MFDNMFNSNGMFNGVIGKIQSGCCRLSLNGRIAVKTSNGYKTYNEKTGNLTDCSNFVLDIADDMFMILPTRTLKKGDIVLINGRPMYILEVKSKNRVEAMRYEDGTIQTVIPERHALLGRKFYGKIVSLFGKGFGSKGGFFKNMLKFKMMSAMLGGNKDNEATTNLGGVLPMMMLMGNGGMDGLFDGLVDDESSDDEDDSEDNGFVNMNMFDEEEDIPVDEGEEFEDDEGNTYVKTGKHTAKKAVKKIAKKTTKKGAK